MTRDFKGRGEGTPDVELVAQLLREQATPLAGLPLVLSSTEGSSNWVFRLGQELAVRLPRSPDYAQDLETEVSWLPRIAAATTTPTPELVLTGKPSALFPRPWAVVTWLPGERPRDLQAEDQRALAADLGAFLEELHRVDVDGVPVGPEHWGYRCDEPVTEQVDAWAKEAAEGLSDLFDPGAVNEAWRRVRDVPARTTTPCLVHTDLSEENVLVNDAGRLAGVIDFGSVGVGDPAVDLLYAWSLFDPPARATLRESAGADETTWLRARAYAFVGPGLLSLLQYRAAMPRRAARLTRLVRSIAAEVGVDLDVP